MGEQIDRIDWRAKQRRMVVSYIGREPDHVVADELVAGRLAEDAGLVLVPMPPGVVRWALPTLATTPGSS